MRGDILLVLLLIWRKDTVRSIRVLELRIPAHAKVGGEALFGCQFDLQGDLLYSVKWYKDGREIYRYMPKNPPERTLMWFERPGVTIDLSRSSSDVVTLTNLQPESAGLYRCEVTGEKPGFALATDEKYVTIHILPKTSPWVSGLRYQYEYGDRLSANCTSPGSRPEAVLKWLVNNKPVHRAHLRGPWNRNVQDPPDTVETTLGLQFMVLPGHYKTGVMQIKCQATIAPLYQREKVFILYPPVPEPEPDLELETELALDPQEESSQSFIQSLDDDDENPTQDIDIIDEKDIKDIEEKFEGFRKITDTVQLEPPPIQFSMTTELPGDTKGYATKLEKAVEVILVALLTQIILL